jgi:hypothetical protein
MESIAPLRQSFSVTDKDGKSYPLRFELADFSMAQRDPELRTRGVKLTPFGQTEFWTTIDEDPLFSNLVLLYVGLRRMKPTLEGLIDMFPTEIMLPTVGPILEEAIADFSRRIATLGQTPADAPPPPPNQA